MHERTHELLYVQRSEIQLQLDATIMADTVLSKALKVKRTLFRE